MYMSVYGRESKALEMSARICPLTLYVVCDTRELENTAVCYI